MLEACCDSLHHLLAVGHAATNRFGRALVVVGPWYVFLSTFPNLGLDRGVHVSDRLLSCRASHPPLVLLLPYMLLLGEHL